MIEQTRALQAKGLIFSDKLEIVIGFCANVKLVKMMLPVGKILLVPVSQVKSEADQ